MTTQTQVRSTEEALKLALDWCYCLEDGLSDEGVLWHVRVRTLLTDLVPAIKEALAQPAVSETHKQEPVAWLGFNERGGCREVFTRDMKKTLPNYPTEGMTPVYTTPPQRKPLTDEQMNKIWFEQNKTHGSVIWRFARAIEAAHGIKEKNT